MNILSTFIKRTNRSKSEVSVRLSDESHKLRKGESEERKGYIDLTFSYSYIVFMYYV